MISRAKSENDTDDRLSTGRHKSGTKDAASNSITAPLLILLILHNLQRAAEMIPGGRGGRDEAHSSVHSRCLLLYEISSCYASSAAHASFFTAPHPKFEFHHQALEPSPLSHNAGWPTLQTICFGIRVPVYLREYSLQCHLLTISCAARPPSVSQSIPCL